MKYYMESRRRGTYYVEEKEGRLTGLVTSFVGTACENTLLKGKIEMTGRRGRRCEHLVDDLKETSTGS
jgi:hypothetical protein